MHYKQENPTNDKQNLLRFGKKYKKKKKVTKISGKSDVSYCFFCVHVSDLQTNKRGCHEKGKI
jgi:hypothetical protein